MRALRRAAGDVTVIQKDVGGDEFYQLYRLDSGRLELLTDGKSRNEFGAWSSDGALVGYSSTRRNGTDTDLYVMNPRDAKTDRRVAECKGGGWNFADFSPDGAHAVVRRVHLDHELEPLAARCRLGCDDADRRSLQTRRLRRRPVCARRNALGHVRPGVGIPATRHDRSQERQVHATCAGPALGRRAVRHQRRRTLRRLRAQRRRHAARCGCSTSRAARHERRRCPPARSAAWRLRPGAISV